MNFNFLLFFIVVFMAYSIYIATSFTDTMLLQTFRESNFESLQLKENVLPGDEITFIINYADVFIFIFVAIIGISYLMHKYRKSYLMVLALFTLVMVILSIPSPLQMLVQFMNLFQAFRIILIVTPFLAFAMAYGIYLLWNNQVIIKKSKYFINISFLIVLSFYFFTSVALHISNDCDDFSWKKPREYFTSSEINSFRYVEKFITYNSDIYSDYYTARYFRKEKFSKSEELKLPYYDSNTIEDISNIIVHPADKKEYFIFRKYEYEYEGLLVGGETNRTIKNSKDYSLDYIMKQMEKDHKNMIFSNRMVEIFN